MSQHLKKKPVKICYDHIGGKLGTLIFNKFLEDGWLSKDQETDKHFFITEEGHTGFQKLGIDITQIKDEAL